MTKRTGSWEQMGAASGLLAALLFVVSFVVFFLGADPGGDPKLPNIAQADLAPAYLAAHLTQIKVAVLFSVLGFSLFLWFLGTIWAVLKRAEGEDGRGSSIALIGGVSAAVLGLAGHMLVSTAGLATSAAQADVVPTLYTASALLIALSGGLLSIFFFAVAKVVFQTQVLPKAIGILAVIAALLSVSGFMTPFFAANVLNAADGALGRVAWEVAFVVWLLATSIVMTLEQRRRTHAAVSGGAA